MTTLTLARLPSDDLCGPDDPPGRCECREAVTRAFRGMQESGVTEAIALDAATRVYLYHHPEATSVAALHTVETWVRAATLH